MNEEKQKLQTQIEELEKRISALSKRLKDLGNNQELQTQIDQIQSAIEEIGINLDNIITNIGDIQISELNSNINSAMQDIENLETQISTMQTNLANATNIATGVQSQVQTNTTNINKNTSKINSNTNKITNLTTRVTNAENNILALTGGIDVGAELNEIDARLDEIDSDSIKTSGDYLELETNLRMRTLEENSTISIVFFCTPYEAIKLNFSLLFSSVAMQNISIQLKINDEQYKEYNTELKQNDSTFNVEEIIYCDKKVNSMQFFINSPNYIYFNLKKINLNAIGRNFLFITDDNNFGCCVFDNKYYLSYTKGDSLFYGVLDKSQLSLSNLTENNIKSKFNFNYFHIFPNLQVQNNTLMQSSTEPTKLACRHKNGMRFADLQMTQATGRAYTNALTVNYSPVICFRRGYDYCFATYTSYAGGMATGSIYNLYDFSNTIKILHEFVEFFPVLYNYETNNSIPVYHNFMLVLKCDGFLYLMKFVEPHYVPYQIKLSQGRFATAYLQQDLKTINVYYNRGNFVYLSKIEFNDDSNTFTIVSNNFLMKGKRFFEGIDNKNICISMQNEINIIE